MSWFNFWSTVGEKPQEEPVEEPQEPIEDRYPLIRPPEDYIRCALEGEGVHFDWGYLNYYRKKEGLQILPKGYPLTGGFVMGAWLYDMVKKYEGGNQDGLE